MTNYEAIKQMSQEEMAAIFYLFVRPMLDGLSATDAQREEVQGFIKVFLATEVKQHEGTK